MKIKILDKTIKPPSVAHDGDAGLDLRAADCLVLEPGERGLIPLGVSIEIPSGYVGLLFPRSGNAIERGLSFVNCVGVIDSGYRGEVCAEVINHGSEKLVILDDDKIAQLVVVPCLGHELEYVEELDETDRNKNGFGSSGN